MENDNKELADLKVVYDELWSDAKALADDMRRSISVYWYAAVLTFLIAFVIGLNSVGSILNILSGSADFWAWYNSISGIVFIAMAIVFGAILTQWYFKFKKKYSKLIQLEKNLGDK